MTNGLLVDYCRRIARLSGRFSKTFHCAIGTVLLCYQPQVLAVECSNQGFIGRQESGQYISNQANWNTGNSAFTNSNISSMYASINLHCSLMETLTSRIRATWEHSQFYRMPGELEGEGNSSIYIFNEAFLSWTPFENLYFDVGKIDKKSGFLFSISPMDKMRNTTGNPRGAQVNVKGSQWREFYREGAVGLSATVYHDAGTIEVTALPRLADRGNNQKSASDWQPLERTNNNDRYAISFISTGLGSITPSLTLYMGDNKGIALGSSSYLTDNLLLSIEGSFMRKKLRELDFALVNDLYLNKFPRQLFSNKAGNSAELGIGLRYMRTNRQEFGVEYFAQSRGYSRSSWDNYFSALNYVNGGYANQFPAQMPVPSYLKSVFQQYSRLFAVELDNSARSETPMGKHYLTVYMSNKNDELRSLNFSASSVINLVDFSSLANVHANTYFTENLEGYLGSYYSFGLENTEFGQFGEKGSFYVGMQYIW